MLLEFRHVGSQMSASLELLPVRVQWSGLREVMVRNDPLLLVGFKVVQTDGPQ